MGQGIAPLGPFLSVVHKWNSTHAFHAPFFIDEAVCVLVQGSVWEGFFRLQPFFLEADGFNL
jgi:hypothetical protein